MKNRFDKAFEKKILRKFFRIRLGTSPFLRKKADEGEMPRAASCTNVSLQRVKGFLVATKDRSGRAQAQKTGTSRRKSRRQPWAREKGSKNSVVVHTMWRQKRQWCLGRSEHFFLWYAWQIDVKASVYNAWQISPICPLQVKGAFLLDGTKCFHDKNQGRIVLKDAEGISPAELRRNNGKCEYVKVWHRFHRR